MIGSGGMARTHLEAFMCVRNIKKVKVFSPPLTNREHFAEEILNKHDLEVIVCDEPEKIYENSDIDVDFVIFSAFLGEIFNWYLINN